MLCARYSKIDNLSKKNCERCSLHCNKMQHRLLVLTFQDNILLPLPKLMHSKHKHSYRSACPSRWDQNVVLKHWQPTTSVARETSKHRKGLNLPAEEALNLTKCGTLKHWHTIYILRIIGLDIHATNQQLICPSALSHTSEQRELCDATTAVSRLPESWGVFF
jgi:hypothetical protein